MSTDLRDRLQATLGSAYTLEHELGGGGMSRVFVATEIALGRRVVVKVLSPELAEGVSVERFKREIQLAARLQHPHIVPVLSAGEMSGLPYYLMPLVNGDSLRTRLSNRTPVPISEVVSILRDVAKALACAHESGVAHRDIKPENVLLTGGSAVVTDFGVAKALSASKTLARGETFTQAGTSLGTPAYMAPEQVAADPNTDHRADIYAFGVLAYEMLAGRPPFYDRTPQKLLAAQMGERPQSISELRSDAPPLLAELVMKCLEKDPDDRPQSANALVFSLEQVTSGGGLPAMPETFGKPMLRLRLLGSRELERTDHGDASAVFAQPKRFALLAYVACRADRFHRRDSLLAVFWPELDTFAARRALRNALYQLKLALGEDVFIARGDDELMVDRTKLWCDVPALGESLAAARYEEAVALYRGELLDGVHVSGVGEEFETWLQQERAQALERVLRALEHLCREHEAAGRLAAAAQAAIRATQLAPFDEAWVRRAVVALHASGDRGGAFTLFDSYARKLAEEFEATPNSETVALVDRLRLGAEPIPLAIVSAAPPMAPTPNASAPLIVPSTLPAPSPPARRPRYAFAAIAAAALLAIAGGFYYLARPHAQPSPRRRVIVTVFANRTGDASLDPIADMMIDWVTRSLLAEHVVDVVDPRALYARGRDSAGHPVDAVLLARHNGANLIIDGSYYRSGDSLLFTANLLDATGHVLRSVGPLSASISTPAAGVEATRARVMMSLASVIDPRLAVAWRAGRAPPAFEAYVPYMEGLDEFWSGQLPRAESSFALAASRDSGFDAAAVALATTAANDGKCRVVDSLDQAMSARRRSLDKVDYLTLRVAVTRCHGHNDEMYRLASQRARLVSETSPYQISAASAAMWANHPADAAALLERIDPTVDLDWMPDASHGDYWENLIDAYHLLGRYGDELAASRRLDQPDDLSGIMDRAQALAGLKRGSEALRVMDSSLTRPYEPDLSNGMAPDMDGREEYRSSAAWVILWTMRELDVHGSVDAARTAAAHGATWCDGRPLHDRSAPEIRFFKALFLEESGAFDSAQAIMRGLVAEDSSNVALRGIMAGLAAERGDTATARRLDDWLAHRTSDEDSWGPTYYRARVATLLGRPTEAIALVRTSLELGAWPMWIHIDPVLHRLAPRADYRALTFPRG